MFSSENDHEMKSHIHDKRAPVQEATNTAGKEDHNTDS